MVKSIWSKIKGVVRGCLPFYLFTFLLLLSCSEEKEENTEYANWQTRNESYFEQQYQLHLAAATSECFVLPSITQPSSLELKDVEHTKCILVDVISRAEGDSRIPLHNDVVAVHYEGRLLPSKSYADGYVFDCSWDGAFDPAVANPYELGVSEFINGFYTALDHMHVGDRWRVTIPYQLGYGVSGASNIPGYSTLIFDIRLAEIVEDE